MKILIVIEYFPKSDNCEVRGGVEARCFYIAKELSKKNDVIILTSWEQGTKKEDYFSGIKVIRCGKQRKYSQSGSILARISFTISSYLVGRSIKTDIVEGYNFLSYLSAYYIAKKNNAKSIATYHDVWLGSWIKNVGFITGIFGELYERLNLSRKWDCFIANSYFTKENLVKVRINKDRINVVYNGVDLENYNKIKAIKESNTTICCIARLVSYKKVDDLINALSIIKKKIPNIKCNIIGIGPEEDNLKNLSKRLDLDKNVDFLGTLEDHKEVIKKIKESHLFCLPSIVEGFGMVVVEAMAANVPYICSDIKPIKEITNNGKGGLLFSAGNYNDLADKILELLDNKKLYIVKKKEAILFVKQYDWKLIVKKLQKIYDGLLK